MTLTLIFLGISALMELAIHTIPRYYDWLRVVWLSVIVGLVVALSYGLIVSNLSLLAAVFAVVSLFRIFNLARIMKGRMHHAYLYRTSFVTSLWLIGVQLLVVALAGGLIIFNVSEGISGYTIGVMQVLAGLVVVYSAWRVARTGSDKSKFEGFSDKELPSISVAVAARNESEDLIICIDALLASDYPKLEIIVLDDCSQAIRTPEIIRSYAHKGVRFVQGDEPSATWLAKNHAYASLAKAASGKYIVFASVNTHFERESLRKLVSYNLHENMKMVSVMPRNSMSHQKFPLIEPLRYGWEAALPRGILRRPPVLSSCWIIQKTALKKAGGFAAVSRMIIPEAFFARQLASAGLYSFLPSAGVLGISSHKTRGQQLATAIRTSYPSLHRRPEMVLLTSLLALALGVLPFIAVLRGVITLKLDLATLLALIACSLLLYGYKIILQLMYGKHITYHIFTLPFAVVAYVVILNYSMYKYEFSKVIWKDRNICIPVMHVVPHLPKY